MLPVSFQHCSTDQGNPKVPYFRFTTAINYTSLTRYFYSISLTKVLPVYVITAAP